jgi:hypothetical protein
MNLASKICSLFGLTASLTLGSPSDRAGAVDSKPLRWLFANKAAAALASNSDVSRLLDSTRPFVFAGPALKVLPPGWKAVPVRSFKSFDGIRCALEAKALGPEVRGVMYDYEKWRFTPAEEQQNPAGRLKEAADIVHAQGLLFFTAPAVDLVAVLAPDGDRTRQDETYCAWVSPPTRPATRTSSTCSRNGLNATRSATRISSGRPRRKPVRQIQKSWCSPASALSRAASV